MTQKDTCTPIFKIWKQPKCPWTRGMGKENVVIHTMEYYSAIKKDEIMPFAATLLDLEIVILSEVSQKENYCMISVYMVSKMIQMNLQNRGSRTYRMNLWFLGGGGMEEKGS